jgi:hypothetical protein
MTIASSKLLGRVTLCWMPLGAGQHVVRVCGHTYEAISALAHHRPPTQLYHSALVIDIRAGRFLIEMAPPRSSGQRPGPGWHAGLVAARRGEPASFEGFVEVRE